jgi:hypothetical protein
MTVRRHISSGKLRAVRAGRSVRIERSALEQFLTPVHSDGTEGTGLAGRPLSFDAPIWKLVGLIDDDGPTDGSTNHDKYLAEAYGDLHDE